MKLRLAIFLVLVVVAVTSGLYVYRHRAELIPRDRGAQPAQHAVTLRWQSSPGTSLYNVYRGLKSGGPYTKIASTPLAFYVDRPVPAGAQLYYVVTAVNSAGESKQGVEMKVIVPTSATGER